MATGENGMHFAARCGAGLGLALSVVLAHAQVPGAYSLHERSIERMNGARDMGALSADVYYVNGVNKRDGMTAMIGFERKFLIMSSDSFVLNDCGALTPSRNCINSKYFTLYHDPAVDFSVGGKWVYESARFDIVRECFFDTPAGNVKGFDIESSQFYGTFNFYVSSSQDLLGWRLNYGKGVDLYLRDGVRLGSCRQRRR